MDQQIPQLRDRLSVLWRRKLIVVAAVMVTTAAATWHSVQQPKVYSASSRLVMLPVLPPAVFGTDLSTSGGGALGLDFSIDTQATLLQSPAVAEGVLKSLHLGMSSGDLLKSISVKQITDQILEVDASERSPRLAASVASAFATQYLDYRRLSAASAIQRLAGDLSARTTAIQASIDALDARMVSLSIDASGAGDTLKKAQLQSRIQQVTSQRNDLVAQLSALQARAQDLQASRPVSSGPGQIIAQATIPTRPSSPQPIRDGIVGFVLGLLLGVGLALLRDQMDQRILTRDQAAEAAAAPILAAVPYIPRQRKDPSSYLSLSYSKFSPGADAYRELRAGLMARGLGAKAGLVLVTSASPGEGKTTTVANLAVVSGRAGLRTLVVSADIRRPTLSRIFQITEGVGLANVLRGNTALSDAVRPTKFPDVFFLRPGSTDGNPDILASPRLASVLALASSQFDLVLIDAPPFSIGGDVATLAPKVDGVILVVRANHVRPSLVTRAAGTLDQVGAPLWGVVLNAVRKNDKSAGFPHRYYDYYRRQPDAPAEKPVQNQGPAADLWNGNGPKREGLPKVPGKQSPSRREIHRSG